MAFSSSRLGLTTQEEMEKPMMTPKQLKVRFGESKIMKIKSTQCAIDLSARSRDITQEGLDTAEKNFLLFLGKSSYDPTVDWQEAIDPSEPFSALRTQDYIDLLKNSPIESDRNISVKEGTKYIIMNGRHRLTVLAEKKYANINYNLIKKIDNFDLLNI